MKTSAKRTPQPSLPKSAPTLPECQEEHVSLTTARLSGLRKECLIRDRYRCVISRRFDLGEAEKRVARDGPNAKDDEGRLLTEESEELSALQVAHILPHALMSDSGQTDSKGKARQVLNMFDHGVLALIDGVEIDQPFNALTLDPSLHQLFGDFKAYFEPMAGARSSTYTIRQTTQLPSRLFPVTRTFYDTPNRTIDLPSPRLLAIHRAIALILHLSAAGEYIDRILRDMDDLMVKSDGTTELGQIVALRLGGWWGGSIQAY